MKLHRIFPAFAAIAAMSLLCTSLSIGQRSTTALDPSIKVTFVSLGEFVPGALYEPVAPGKKSHIGILLMHSGADYLSHNGCAELSKRGYRVLCANTSGRGLDKILLDAKLAVDYLRAYPGIQKVVLWGHSGGATLMTAYQMVAENGVKACQGPEKIIKCSDTLAALPPADGVILGDSNWGNAEMTLFSIDPAVTSEESGITVNPDLDLFNPKNGFNPSGNSDYSQEFIHKWQTAEGKRENELVNRALDRLAAIQSGKGRLLDDEPFFAPGTNSTGGNNKLFAQDVKLMSHTQKAWPLIHADGSVTTEIVHTVRVPKNMQSLTATMAGAVNTTVISFLKNSAIRVTSNFGYDEDAVHGVEWTSSYSSPPGNVESIHVPLLVIGMTGNWEYLASETIYEHAASSDKSLAFVEGANHEYDTCKKCEKYPGQFGDTIKTLYDYADKWLSQKGRF